MSEIRAIGLRGLRRFSAAVLALPLAATCLVGATVPAQAHSPSAGPPVMVSMGDSYISGEGGRWAGNSDTSSGSRAGTDRAWTGNGYDPERVYGASYRNGCDRSDSAEIRSAFGPSRALNIACSGASTINIFRTSHGGKAFKREAPQADQLAQIAARYDVRVIALSIGGNDLDFKDVIETCVWHYEYLETPCQPGQQREIDEKIDKVMGNVGKAIDEIHAVMSAAGRAPSSYRFVLQSYPSPIPRASDYRYPQSGWDRTLLGGCPLRDDDSHWARFQLVPQIARHLAQVAASRGVQFLDLRDFLQAHEVCTKHARLATPGQGPSPATSEWTRFLAGVDQPSLQESFHPNYYGQLGLGRCLSLVTGQPATQNYACESTPDRDAAGVYLRRIS
ncbi:hypothetical protein DN069_13780 [Streptacidiphilus pinicola]|uniref:SGNH hydrolase-type esterase domain-containing protein n=1 Tax=Streptacidiphilus pinicola TaxID=2219663 RepID=A0A2X0K6X8_9ACTN|nr:GDSL-type esterase/lipase family protein [Streptacidiphilus pinicola]RAG85025.1 hypothetical protein DN069_13780 [Streptacidiphilus pinicola]